MSARPVELGFEGRVAIVTGAGGGLGRAHALELARRGAAVVVNDLGGAQDGTGSSTSAARRVVDEIRAAGGEAVPNFESVASPEGGERIVQTAIDEFGRVDIIVNNAGILRDASFKRMDAANVDPVLDVHLRGAFHVTRPAWTHMRSQGYGRIVNTSSGVGIFGNFGQANYGAAKAGLIGLTRVLAIEGARDNIRANAIAPAARTRMTESLTLGPLSDLLEPTRVSAVVAFLAHESCEMSGEILSVAGGWVARIFVGECRGYTDVELTAEDVATHLAEICDETGYRVPRGVDDELAIISEALNAS